MGKTGVEVDHEYPPFSRIVLKKRGPPPISSPPRPALSQHSQRASASSANSIHSPGPRNPQVQEPRLPPHGHRELPPCPPLHERPLPPPPVPPRESSVRVSPTPPPKPNQVNSTSTSSHTSKPSVPKKPQTSFVISKGKKMSAREMAKCIERKVPTILRQISKRSSSVPQQVESLATLLKNFVDNARGSGFQFQISISVLRSRMKILRDKATTVWWTNLDSIIESLNLVQRHVEMLLMILID